MKSIVTTHLQILRNFESFRAFIWKQLLKSKERRNSVCVETQFGTIHHTTNTNYANKYTVCVTNHAQIAQEAMSKDLSPPLRILAVGLLDALIFEQNSNFFGVEVVDKKLRLSSLVIGEKSVCDSVSLVSVVFIFVVLGANNPCFVLYGRRSNFLDDSFAENSIFF